MEYRTLRQNSYATVSCVRGNKHQLPEKFLTDVTPLQKFIFLRYINIAFNELKNLVPLENLHNLLVLNASYNQITEFPVGNWPALTHLYLDHNRITELREVHMPRLQLLSLNNNHLTKLFNTLNGEPVLNGRDLPELHTLELAHNKLYLLDKASPDDLGAPVSLRIQLPKLKALFLNHNALTSLATYKLCPKTRFVNMLDELPTVEDDADDVFHKEHNAAKPPETDAAPPEENNQGESTEIAPPLEEQVVGEEEEFIWIREENGSALGDLPQLSVLSLRSNGLLDLDGLTYKAVPKLQYLNLRENAIGLLDEVNKLAAFPRLQTLILLENPIYNLKDYRLEMRINLQTLRRLDKDTYTPEENDEADKIAEERQKERLAAEVIVSEFNILP
ncbi:uncharacterized protein DEA37_0007641 [Paragonimus westermani]|uniref:Leucine-rich repeat-containing protein 23 n=1 Tax=Paragonimus westermani TaxID=34504 RepID=A0A5J4NHY2_9TREM|nr:uncharacterized protein DEA37_0007641 [Paragonimus westermani]